MLGNTLCGTEGRGPGLPGEEEAVSAGTESAVAKIAQDSTLSAVPWRKGLLQEATACATQGLEPTHSFRFPLTEAAFVAHTPHNDHLANCFPQVAAVSPGAHSGAKQGQKKIGR